MDLFSIICTTCKSRLRVREQGAIGQILACPKCGGMVMVKAPDGWEPGKPFAPRGPEPVPGITAVVEMKKSDATPSEANFEAIDDTLAAAPPRPKRPVVTVAADAPGLAPTRFVSKSPHPTPADGKVAASGNGAAATAAAVNAPPVIAKEALSQKGEADEPLPDFRPPQTSPWHQRFRWPLLAASILAGVALAFAAVVASVKFFSGNPTQQPVVANARPPVNPNPNPALAQPAATTKTPPATASPSPSQATPTDPATTVPAATTPPTTASPTPPTAPQTTTPKPPEPASPFDQILAPEKDPLAPKETTTPKAANPPPADPADPAPADPAVPARPRLPRPEPRQIDVAMRLKDPLASIESETTPLADFLQIMADLSTIPITLEPDALPLAQANAASPVALNLSNTTIGAALSGGLSRLGLEHVTAGDHLIVRLSEPAEMAELPYTVSDLTGGDDATATELAEMIQALVDPPSWTLGEAGASIAVDKDMLKIKQRRANHAQIFLLCEKLRTARKLPHKSRHPSYLFQLDSRTKQAAAKLQDPVTINFHQPTPLVRIVPRLEEAGGVRILVDWRDIAQAGWNPAGEAVLTADKEPLALALTRLVEPMDLAWRAVDRQTIQIVTPTALATRTELEFYPVADLVKDDPAGESLIAKVRESLGSGLFLDQGGPCEVRFDLASQCLIASLSQLKQQDLEALLITLRRPQ